MNKSRLTGALCATAFSFITATAHAVPVTGQGTWETTLQGRDLDGNAATFEAYYDTALDITWLADAYGNGTMNQADANTWAAGLDVNGVTGWRLPTNTPVNGTNYQTSLTTDATTDQGYAPTTTDGTDGGWRDGSGTPVSELGHMYYVTLGSLGRCDPTLPYCTSQTGYGLSNTGPFFQLQLTSTYLSGAQYDPPTYLWYLNFRRGEQSFAPVSAQGIAWAVRPGDVSAIPVPAAVWLFGSGLIGLVGIARRRKAA